MALARLSIKTAEKGKAVGHAEYILREGKYKNQAEKAHELRYFESGNLPKFAKNEVLIFWNAVDEYERINGTAYREMELALPRELTGQQQINLMQEWVEQELGNLHCYTWALHESKSADGGSNPHVHLMFSERRNDGIEREAEQYFKRYNSKNPANGGTQKGYGENFTKKFAHNERIEELEKLRNRWEKIVNKHLELAGHEERISMKSYQDRGVDVEPEKKQLPSQWRKKEVRQQILEVRKNKGKDLELQPLQTEKEKLIPNVQIQILELEADNKQQAISQKMANVYAILNRGLADLAKTSKLEIKTTATKPVQAQETITKAQEVLAKDNDEDIWQRLEQRSKQLEERMRSAGIKLPYELEQEKQQNQETKNIDNLELQTQEITTEEPKPVMKTPEQVRQLWLKREKEAGLTPNFSKNYSKSIENDDLEM